MKTGKISRLSQVLYKQKSHSMNGAIPPQRIFQK